MTYSWRRRWRSKGTGNYMARLRRKHRMPGLHHLYSGGYVEGRVGHPFFHRAEAPSQAQGFRLRRAGYGHPFFRRQPMAPKIQHGKQMSALKPQANMVLAQRPHRHTADRKRMTGLEMFNLRKLAGKFGLAHDVFDFRAHIDRTLTYGENKSAITEKLKAVSGPQEYTGPDEAEWEERRKDWFEDLKFRAESGDSDARNVLKGLGRW